MSVQENILNVFLEDKQQHYTAVEIAEKIDISRNSASHHLNRLVEQSYLSKTATRPTLFSLLSDEKKKPFSEVVGATGSLEKNIDKCKAAMNYPNGLPILLQGRSGTGKSFLAKSIFDYAKTSKNIGSKAHFVILNCADYANNPELLSSVLFGHVKGAFTGADTEKNGLLAEAAEGILFLDEVHNLSVENQEKLFLFIDSGRYRKVGENESWSYSDARLIMATTENTQELFLPTFMRRIPFVLSLPDFAQRPYGERRQLIDTFFKDECSKLDKDILVSKHILHEFISNDLYGNVGQLKNEIKVLVAENILESQSAIAIPPDTELAQSICYTQDYDLAINNLVINYEELDKLRDIQNFEMLCNEIERVVFFVKFTVQKYYGSFESFIEAIENEILESPKVQIEEICRKYGGTLSKSEQIDIFVVLLFVYKFGPIFPFDFPILQGEKIKYYKALTVASKLIQTIKTEMACSQQLLILLMAYLKDKSQYAEKIPAIVVMHGKNNATSIAYTVNELLGDYVYDGFDMPIDVGNEDFIMEIIEFIKKVDSSKGIIVLVDMGSLGDMYSQISNYVEGDLILFNNVSTALALDVGSKVKNNELMENILSLDENLFRVEKKFLKALHKNLTS